jgi:hypothetical protein
MMSLLSDVASMLKKKRRDLRSRDKTTRVCIVAKRLLSQNDVNDTIFTRERTNERTNERTKSNPPKTRETYIFQLIDGIERGSPTRRRPRTTTTFRG